MNADIQDIYNRLLSSHYYEKLFSDLAPFKREGRELLGNCPFCQSDRFSISTTKPLYKCWSCGEAGDYLDYLQKQEKKDFSEALIELGKEAGIEINFDSNYQKSYQKKKIKLTLFEEAQTLFINSLTPDSPQFNYLIHIRKYGEEIKLMELGAYPSTHKVKNYLIKKGFKEEDIRDSGLLKSQLEGRISIPYPNQSGVISGFSFRTINDENKPKYLNTSGLNKNGLVGFQFRPYKATRALVVEGYFDALLLNAKGLKDYWILALGGDSLTQRQIKTIEDSGVEEVLLALDNDDSGRKGTEAAIKALRLSKLRTYVLDWSIDGTDISYKDPDEFVRKEGIDEFKLYLNICCKSWTEWLARHLTQQHLIGIQLGTDGYINQCLEIEQTINDPLEKKQFTQTFLEILKPEGITEEDLALRRIEKAQKTSKGKAREAIATLRKQLKEEDLTGSELAIEESLRKLKASRGVELPSPYLPEDFLLDISKTGEGLKTGYEELDKLFVIPRGAITLVAARPSIGKTTFMLNLFLNLIDLNPDKAFYFFSYEESKSRLGIKLIQNLSGEVISQEFNHNAYIRYFKVNRLEGKLNHSIEEGFNKYSDLVKSGRLWLLDKSLNDADLVATINLLSESRNIGGVFIDYIQKISPSNPTNQDWLNVKNVSQAILDCAVNLDIPVILGCQLNRATEGMKDKRPQLGALRQSGDLEQDANLVLGLYRDEFYNPESFDKGILEVSILKNRNGSTRGVGKLQFIPETLKIADISSSSRPEDDYQF